jgi:hypothetical protein
MTDDALFPPALAALFRQNDQAVIETGQPLLILQSKVNETRPSLPAPQKQ